MKELYHILADMIVDRLKARVGHNRIYKSSHQKPHKHVALSIDPIYAKVLKFRDDHELEYLGEISDSNIQVMRIGGFDRWIMDFDCADPKFDPQNVVDQAVEHILKNAPVEYYLRRA